MAAMDLLKAQHREAQDLLERIKVSTGMDKILLLGRLCEALTLHAELEEKHFYPVLRANGLEELIARSLEEHAWQRRLVSEILSVKRNDPRLDVLIGQLENITLKHVEEEEKDIFPRAEARVPPELLAQSDRDMHEALETLKNKELLEAADEEQPVA